MKNKHTDYLIHLADSLLIQSQRLGEWTGHGPALEQDIALTNIALDQLGQARNLYQYAASLRITYWLKYQMAIGDKRS
jgi:ring-1,2-phenylacetyl-CoA epoxidase subunit PaaC